MGYASPFMEYRLLTPPKMLSDQSTDLLADLADDTQCYDFGLNPAFTGSASAITVLNTLFLSSHLGIRLPRVASAFVFSGAFAYPPFYNPNQTRIPAVHSEHDPKVAVASIRRFAVEASGQCHLVESLRHIHCDLRLTPDETRDDALKRIVQFDREGTLTLPSALASGN